MFGIKRKTGIREIKNRRKGNLKLKFRRGLGLVLAMVLLISQAMSGYVAPNKVVEAATMNINSEIEANGIYRVVNKSTGLIMDVADAGSENGTALQSYNSNGTNAQKFKFMESVQDGYYVIVPMCATTSAIDNPSSSIEDGKAYQLYRQNGYAAQDFSVVYVGDGYYRITNRASGKALQDEGSIVQRTVADDDRQLWKLELIEQTNTFTNPVRYSGADPWVVQAGESYYLCQSDGGVSLFKMNNLNQLGIAQRTNIFANDYSGGVTLGSYWAPELLYLQGRWYVYFAPEVNSGGNDSHRSYVLQGGSNPDDPFDGRYTLMGQLTDSTNKWSIDATAFEYDGQLYAVWSGWEGDTNVSQYIYIAKMSNPWTISSERVCISTPTHSWETVGSPTVNEGPEVLIKNGVVHIIYSASGSWTDDYCLGRLTCTDGNFLNASSWSKSSEPVFKKTDSVWGPGHCSFVQSPDGTEDWIIFHSARYSGGGWNREVHIQAFTWHGNYPYFGQPVDPGVELANPSDTDFESVEDGTYYMIRNVATGRYMDVPNGDDSNSLKIQTWTGNKTAAQQFEFIKKQDGWYAISPKCCTSRALDNPSGSTETGKQYQTWTQNDNKAQNFRLEEVEDGVFRIINQASLYALTDNGESAGYAVTQEKLTNDDNQRWEIVEVNEATLYNAATIPGTGNELYSTDFSNSRDLGYYTGSTAADAVLNSNTLILQGGNANKVVVEDGDFSDFVVETDVLIEANNAAGSTQGGIIFRTSNESSGGNDGYNGYYFGIDGTKQEAILGKVNNGSTWTEIAKKKITVKYDTYYHISVAVSGNEIKCYVNYNGENYAKVVAVDSEHTSGSVGVRHWQCSAHFKNLKVSEYTPEEVTNGYTNAVLPYCADPDILYYNGVYYMYSTNTSNANNGFKVYSSTDLTNWTDRGWCLTKGEVYGTSGFWAPDIIEKDGIFYMYYVANEHLSVATSTSPVGPFTQTETQRVPIHESPKEIDAHVFKDDDGQYYIYFVRFYDGNGNSGNNIWGAKLNSDMRSIDESTLTCLISPTESWETDTAAVAEGPFMLKKDGVYYLTYSGSHFQSISYGSGYATSTSPLGTYTKYANNPIMQSNSLVHGAGHHCVTESPDGSELFMVYHCHKDLSTTEPRSLCIDRMHFTKDDDGNTVLEVLGPTVTMQPFPSGFDSIIETTTVAEVTTTTQNETTTSSSGTSTDLVEVFGMETGNSESGIISVVWGNPENGQLFNVYVDGQLAVSSTGDTLSNVACAQYMIPATKGTHTIKVTGVLNGQETTGVEQTITVSGSSTVETTTVPDVNMDGYVTAGANWTDLNNWSVYFAKDWANNPTGSYKEGGSYNDFGIYVNTASLTAWGIQMKTQPLTVTNGNTYTCKVTADFNMDMTNTITFKEENTNTAQNYTLVNGTNTFEITFVANSDTAQIFFDLGMLPAGANFEVTSFELVGEEKETITEEISTKEETTAVTTIGGGIEINGYQVSATNKGMRTVYSVDSTIDGKEVVASGMVYSLADYATEDDIYVGSTHNYVRNYESTINGVCTESFSESDIATSYAMTMRFVPGTAAEFSANWRIRAYAELSDGTYVYTDCIEYTIYDIADTLYQGCLMNTQTAHEYLYSNILSIVDSEYEVKAYNVQNAVVQ